MNIAVFASGNGSNFESIVEAVNRGEIEGNVALLICDRKNAYVLERAKKHDIPAVTFSPKKFSSKELYEAEVLDLLKAADIELVVLAGYMRIVGQTLLQSFANRIVNIHPSLLPAFPGKNGVLDAYEAGVSVTGVTVHFIDEGVDSGPIIAQQEVAIDRDDTLASLEEKIHRVEHDLYPKTIQHIIKKVESNTKVTA